VSQRKRPSLTDIANIASEAVASSRRSQEPSKAQKEEEARPVQEAVQEETPTLSFKKFTAPFREDQLDQLAILLASWTASKKVRFSSAEVLRLGLDRMLRLMEEEADEAILQLYQQELQETAASETRKFGRSKGAKEYLRKAGKL
jgi:hypothetical protein